MKNWLLNKIMRHLYNAVTEDDVLVFKNRKFFVGGNELPQADTQDIVSGARGLESMLVWQLLLKDLKDASNRIQYRTGGTVEEIRFARAMLWCIDVLEQKVKNIAKLDGKS